MPRTPYIIVSRDELEGTVVEALRGGASDYVVKARLERLAPAVKRALAESEAIGYPAELGAVRSQLQLEFISHLSHDLRTPLTAVKASIGVVLANEPPGTTEPLRRMFRNVDAAADQMSHMVVNLVELAQVVTGGLRLRPTTCDLAAVAGRAAEGLGPQFERRAQRLAMDLPESLPAELDAARLERALWNLLDNANKFGREDGVISFRLEQRDEQAVFIIQDDGPGIAPQFQKLISGESIRPDPSVPWERWPGLGLVTSRFIAEALGGEMTCECPADGGSVVSLCVPVNGRSLHPVVAPLEDRTSELTETMAPSA
jgi:signal transduction histidine kinase